MKIEAIGESFEHVELGSLVITGAHVMSAPTNVAPGTTLVAAHQGHVAAEAGDQDGEKCEADPSPGPVAVAVGAVAGVNVVAVGV